MYQRESRARRRHDVLNARLARIGRQSVTVFQVVASISARSIKWGLVGVLGMAAFYAVVVGGLSGSSEHLIDQIRQDWYLLVPILGGFGAQIAVMAELRRRHRLMGAAMGAGAVGSGASTAGMIACCAHHLADLLPFLGATAAASFLYDVRLAFMIIGLGINGIALAIGISRLKKITVTATEEAACHAI